MKYSFNSPEAIERTKDNTLFLQGKAVIVVREKTIIRITKFGIKPWVGVKFRNPGKEWLPSFEELYYILIGIAQCEKENYGKPEYAAERKLYEFISDALFANFTYEELAEKYKLPDRKPPVFVEVEDFIKQGRTNA